MSVRRVKSLLPHVFEVAVAAGWALVGTAYLIDPGLIERSPVGQRVHPFDTIWSCGYLLGATLVLAALLLGLRPGARVAGLVILGTSLVMAGVAAASYQVEPRVAVYFTHAVACALRVVSLVRVHRAPRRG